MSLFLPFWCSYKVHKCFFFIIETNYNLQSLLIILYILHFFCKAFGAIIKLPLQAFSLFGCTHQLRSPPLLFPHFQLNRRFACVDTSAGWIQKMRGNVVSGWRHYCCILVDGSSHLKAMHTVLLPHINPLSQKTKDGFAKKSQRWYYSRAQDKEKSESTCKA